MVGWLVGWLVGCLVGWLVGWLIGWLVGSSHFTSLQPDIREFSFFPSTFLYTLYFNFLSRFSVVPDNGTISVASPLDFELKQSYSLELEAKDGGKRFTRLPVNITIINANDNTPEFSSTSVNFTLNELVESGKVLGKITVSNCMSLLCLLLICIMKLLFFSPSFNFSPLIYYFFV